MDRAKKHQRNGFKKAEKADNSMGTEQRGPLGIPGLGLSKSLSRLSRAFGGDSVGVLLLLKCPAQLLRALAPVVQPLPGLA